jgi:hypothetical protein
VSIADDSPSSEECTVHPSSSLFHQHEKTLWSVSEGLGIWDVSEVVSLVFLDVDLITHDSIFSQILVSFWARWVCVRIDQLEEGIHGTTLDGFPSEQAVGTWQHRVVAEVTLTSLIWGVTELVFVKLSGSDHVLGSRLVLVQIDLNLTATSTTSVVANHVFVEFGDGIVISSSTDIKHERVLWLKILADTLEKPFVTVDLTVVSLFKAKHEINSSSLELFLLKAEIPGAHLEQMKAVLWKRISGKVFVHELIHGLHFPLATLFFHVAVLSEIALIKELMFDGVVLERLWDRVITITDYGDNDVLLTHLQVFIHVHGVVVLDNTFHGSPELRFILVVHGDTNSKSWLRVLHDTQVFHTSNE